MGDVLDKLEQKIAGILGRSAEAVALATDASARNARLALDALRQDLARDMDEQWDTLEGKKLDSLRKADEYVDRLDKNLMRVERLEELAVLDVEGLLRALPISSTTYAIKSVTGATQFFREEGYYRFEIRSNALDFSGRKCRIRLNKKPVEDGWVAQKRQYEILLTVPAAVLADKFSDSSLEYATLDLDFEVPNRRPWEFWRDPSRTAHFEVRIQLFPRYPIEYRLEEHKESLVVDRSKEEWQPSQVTVVGGCGTDGCYAYHNVYAYLPTGTEPSGRVAECTDTFQGWGSFVKPLPRENIWSASVQENYCTPTSGPVTALMAAGTTVGMLYQQHSHDRTREVQFKAGYHPLAKKNSVVERQLHALNFVRSDKSSVPGASRILGDPSSLQDIPEEVRAGRAQMLMKLVQGAIERAGPFFIRRHDEEPPEFPEEEREEGLRRGFLRYGQTYEARFSSGMVGYTLTMKTFSGDSIVVTEGKSDSRVEVAVTNLSSFKRIVITPKVPW